MQVAPNVAPLVGAESMTLMIGATAAVALGFLFFAKISTQPAALALRYMQTLLDMGSNQNSTIVFPIPIELIRPLLAAPVPLPAPAATNGALPVKAAEPAAH
jgi:hypothetical protein